MSLVDVGTAHTSSIPPNIITSARVNVDTFKRFFLSDTLLFIHLYPLYIANYDPYRRSANSCQIVTKKATNCCAIEKSNTPTNTINNIPIKVTNTDIIELPKEYS